MSEITELIERYRGGEMTLDELADLLANRQYRTPARHQPAPEGWDGSEWAQEHLGTYPEKGTWEEVDGAQLTGLITEEEYQVIYRRRLRSIDDG